MAFVSCLLSACLCPAKIVLVCELKVFRPRVRLNMSGLKYMRCVIQCPCFIMADVSHEVCVMCMGEEHARSVPERADCTLVHMELEVKKWGCLEIH